MKKRGSIILFALFMILFVTTIIAILYLTNKRYIMISKEIRENIYATTKKQKGDMLLYIVNAFVYNGGVLNSVYNAEKIYKNQNETYNFLMYDNVRKIYFNIEQNFLYSTIYDNQNNWKIAKIFNYNVINLYVYDKVKDYVYMPRSIRDVFFNKGLTNVEKNVLKTYKDYLIKYISETFAVNPNNLSTVWGINYDTVKVYAGGVKKNIYQTSIRPVSIAIKFTISGQDYILLSDINLKTQLQGINMLYTTGGAKSSIYGNFVIKTNIYEVNKTSIKKMTQGQEGIFNSYPWSF